MIDQHDLQQAFKLVDITYNEIPQVSQVLQNYPNPFNPETWIPFQLDRPSEVDLKIYDVNGHLIRSIDCDFLHAGTYFSKDRALYWDGRSNPDEKN